MEVHELRNCPDCGVKPGEVHKHNCDVEMCSVCGGQRLMDSCEGHDKCFARWTGIWPGAAEASHLNMDLNTFYEEKLNEIFFIKPK